MRKFPFFPGILLIIFFFPYLVGKSSENHPSNIERDLVAMPVPKNLKQWENQKAFFKEKGYLWIKDFFNSEQVLLLKNWTHKIGAEAKLILTENQETNPSKEHFIIVAESQNPSQVCRVEDMLSFNPKFDHFIETTLTPFLNSLFGEPYTLFKDKLNFKWPGGGAFLPHQDFPAYQSLSPREHITVMITIDSATLENGCLHIADDWKESLADTQEINQELLQIGKAVLPHIEGGTNHGSIVPKISEKLSWIPIKTTPKDLLIFSSFLPHYSEKNLSANPRRAMFFTYNRLIEGDCKSLYFQTKRSDPENPEFHFGTPTKARGK